VKRRDGWRCTRCGKDDRRVLKAHHIIAVQDGGEHTEANMITLCHTCHEAEHHGEREAMTAKRQKPLGTTQDKRAGRAARTSKAAPGPVVLAAVPRADAAIPACPEGLDGAAQRAWADFWHSPMAHAVDYGADGAALRRWIACVSERAHVAAALAGELTVEGSMGQKVLNPLVGYMDKLTKEVTHYEEHFGMTALSRMRLGIAIESGKASIADLAARLDTPAPVRGDNVIDLGELG